MHNYLLMKIDVHLTNWKVTFPTQTPVLGFNLLLQLCILRTFKYALSRPDVMSQTLR